MKEFKEKIYELEGLVELASQRPDKLEELRPLISRRLDEVVSVWKHLPEPAVTADKHDEVEASEPGDPMKDNVTADIIDEGPDSDDIPLYIADDEEPEAEESVGIESEHHVSRPDAETHKPIVLCLNDRFRFTRILAAGERVKFDKLMSRLSEFGGFEEARDYVIDTCNLDPEDSDAADFIDILQQYFEN